MCSSQLKNKHLAAMFSGSEAGSYLRLVDFCTGREKRVSRRESVVFISATSEIVLGSTCLAKDVSRLLGFGFRVPSFGFRICQERDCLGQYLPCQRWSKASGFRVSVSRFRVSGFGFWVSGFGVWVSDFGFRVPGFGFRVRQERDCLGQHLSCQRHIKSFGFRVSGSGFRVSGLSGARFSWAIPALPKTYPGL